VIVGDGLEGIGGLSERSSMGWSELAGFSWSLEFESPELLECGEESGDSKFSS